jgi:DNA-binding transcriptional regulator YiaG
MTTKAPIGAEEVTPEAIIWMRKRLGLTQSQMGRRIGAGQHMVSYWETGARRPSRLYRQLLAAMHNGIVRDKLAQLDTGNRE